MVGVPIKNGSILSLCLGLTLSLIVLALSGCSWLPFWSKNDPATGEQVQQEQQDQKIKKEQKAKNTSKEQQEPKDQKRGPEQLVMKVAQTTPGQRDNTPLGPGDYGEKNEILISVLTELMENLKANNLEEAKNLLHGLDGAEGVVTITELQREVETLYPVSWHLDGCRPVGLDGALVTVSFLWPNGTARQVQPFSMQSTEGLWTVHFNSFAASFHEAARHLIEDEVVRNQEVANQTVHD